MKHKLFIIIAILMVVLINFSIFPQDDSQTNQEREITVEELYLRNIEFQILKEKAFAGGRDMKLQALDDLEDMIEGDRVMDDNSQIAFVLEYLAFEGTTRKVRMSNRLVNDFPEVRRKASELLGQIGGERAKDVLLTVLLQDEEPMVKSQAAYSLGLIGINNNEEVGRIMAHVLNGMTNTNPDNNFAFATLYAFEKIAEKNNGIRDALVFQSIIGVAQGNYIDIVKSKALQLLDSMKQYDL